jgi:flavin reductase (DIM6/NTAB) family NADH-FMN oxidoreductase RutF
MTAKNPLFSSEQFRKALGTFATGVTVVTACNAEGERFGLTANSFNSVSLQPPLVLWSLSRSASSMPVFSRGSHYAIHILASDQKNLALQFAAKNVDRFAGISVQKGMAGAPILPGVLAVFECFNRSQYEEGDHVIFVGQVEHCSRREQAQPLLYHDGKFFTELAVPG